MQVEVNGDNDGDDDKMKSWTHMSSCPWTGWQGASVSQAAWRNVLELTTVILLVYASPVYGALR